MDQEPFEIRCPSCGARYWVDLDRLGSVAECGQCGYPFTLMAKGAGAGLTEEIRLTLEGGPPCSNVTVNMRERGIQATALLEDSNAATVTREVLAAGSGRKYVVGEVVAKGGMGAVLSCRDLNVRRNVAMKVMLDPEKVNRGQVLHFIEEAQVTGQLEHPGVVPVYELGVDASNHVFYTMKFVRGRTLKGIIKGLAEHDDAVLKVFPLGRLLSIFLRICEAVAYAHHRHVIHRDLKPENIMVGDFGEVYVMDWGLAKVLGMAQGAWGRGQDVGGGIPAVGSGLGAREGSGHIDRARSDLDAEVVNTLDGAVLGTPSYMAPEQAEGKVAALDERADIYALGGILYEILALHAAIEDRDVSAVLTKLIRGELTPLPTDGDPATRPHCPDGRIPAALAAVAAKALAPKPDDRYRSVQELQADIERYQSGFATSAEQAGLWRQLVLLVKRHRTFAISAASIVLALTVGLSVALVQWRRAAAERERALAAEHAEKEQRQAAEKARDETKVALGKAEEERQRALTAEQVEKEQRQIAEKARDEAKLAQDKAEQESYYNTIALADARMKDGLFDEAEKMLWDTVPARRGWEWGNLLLRCHQDLVTLDQHNCTYLAFSPDGKLLRTSPRGAIAWDMATHTQAFILKDGGSILRSARGWSPDGRTLLVADGNDSAQLWDVATGTATHTFRLPGAQFSAVALSPDGLHIALGDRKEVVTVWDVAQETKVLDLVSPSNPSPNSIRHIHFSPDGTKLLASDGTGMWHLWDATNGQVLRHFRGRGGGCFSPDGRFVAIAGFASDSKVDIWSLEKKSLVVTLRGHEKEIPGVAYSSDGCLLVTGGEDGTVRVWDASTGRQRCVLLGHSRQVEQVAFSPDGRIVASYSRDRQLRLWSADGPLEPRLLGTERCMALAFSPDGKSLMAAGGHCGQIWDLSSGQITGELQADKDLKIRILDLSSGETTEERQAEAGRKIPEWQWDVAWSRDGHRVLTVNQFGYARLWDPADGREIAAFVVMCPVERGLQGSFSPDGKRLVTFDNPLGRRMTAQIRDSADGHEVRQLHNPDNCGFMAATWLPDGKTILTSNGGPESMLIWNAGTADPPRRLATSYRVEDLLASSVDGRWLAGTTGGNVFVWELPALRRILTLKGHGDRAIAGSFSPDGRLLAIGDNSGNVRLWQRATGRLLLVLHVGGAGARSVEFSRDGMSLAVAQAHSPPQLWHSLDGRTTTPESFQEWKRARYQRWLAENVKE